MYTINDVITFLKQDTKTIPHTVDQLYNGSLASPVERIGVCFMPTIHVIKRALDLQIDLLVCHEGLFYSHQQQNIHKDDWLSQEKKKIIADSSLAIFRYHDYAHRGKQDFITEGLLHALNWNKQVTHQTPVASIVQLPKQSLQELIKYIQTQLHIHTIRYIGDLYLEVSKVACLVGYRGGGQTAIPQFVHEDVDVVLYGEGPEWETPEWIRDRNEIGAGKAGVILGHVESEEPGMEYITTLLQRKFNELSINHIPSNNNIQTYCAGKEV